MSKPSLNKVSHKNGFVILSTRYWDGIDHPDHVSFEGLSPYQAYRWAEIIIDCAAEAEAYNQKAKDVNLTAKRAKLRELKDEIEKIERELE